MSLFNDVLNQVIAKYCLYFNDNVCVLLNNTENEN